MNPFWELTLDQTFQPEPWAYDPRLRPAYRDREAMQKQAQDMQRMGPILELRKKLDDLRHQQYGRQHQDRVATETHRHNVEMERRAAANSGSRDFYDRVEGANGEYYWVPKSPTSGLPTMPVQDPSGGHLTRTQPLTAGELEALRENAQQIHQAIRALRLMRGETFEGQQGDSTATGWEGYIPNIAQLLPGTIWAMGGQEGVGTRAAVGNIGSLRIKNRSGGAVPAAEMSRLTSFVPSEKDQEDVARTKLTGFINEYANMLEEDLGYYRSGQRRVPHALERMVRESVLKGRQALGPQNNSDQAYREALIRAIREHAATNR